MRGLNQLSIEEVKKYCLENEVGIILEDGLVTGVEKNETNV